MLKALLRSVFVAVAQLIFGLTVIGVLGGLQADVVGDDPGLNAVVSFCGNALRTVFRVVRNYPEGCGLGFFIFVALHAFVTQPGIETQKTAFNSRRASARGRRRYKKASANKKAKKGGR